MRRILLALLTLLLLVIPVSGAPSLGGKEVILVVSAERHDLAGESIELALRSMRNKLGLTTEELPVVRMGLLDPDGKPEYFQNLGISQEQLPVVCLVSWGSPAENGPQSVLDDLLEEQVQKDQSEERAREVLKGWLIRNGKDNLVGLITPPPPASEPQPPPEDIAFQEGRLEEALTLAREHSNPTIEHQARQALQEKAAVAYAEKRLEDALPIYKFLAEHYPGDQLFQEKVQELSVKPADLISGKWELRSSRGWLQFTAFPDGRLKGKSSLYLMPIVGNREGHWVVTGEQERTFQLHWKNGKLHNIKLHENGQTFDGHGVRDGNVSGKRLPEQ